MYRSVRILIFYVFAGILETFAFQHNMLDTRSLDTPILKPVKALYEQGDSEKAKKMLLDIFRKRKNLYIRVSEEDIPDIRIQFGKEVENSLRTAGEVKNKYFLFRYEWDMEKTNIPYKFPGETDWDAEPFGDEEWTFMLNRHRYWIDLGKAYFLTGKEKYARTFVQQVTHWIDNNPLEDAKKQTSWRRIEAGIRAENWIKTFELLKNSRAITPDFIEKFLGALYVHADFLNSAYNRHSQISNWGILEFHGLFNLSVFLSDFRQAAAWQKNAISRLETCIRNQILEDGTQWEQSPMYHNEVFHCYLNTLLLAQRRQIRLPAIIHKKTRDMAYANIMWQKPDYHEPLLGDSDDNDLRGLLTTAALLFGDGTIKSRAFETPDYENFFIFSEKDKQTYTGLRTEDPGFLSAWQQNTGDLYSRSSWEHDAYYSSFHMKRLGGGHSHDDLLHFTLYAHHRDYLIDGGRYTYVNTKWRKYFKENSAHNTLGVDHLPNSIYSGSWSNAYEARSEGAYTVISEQYDYAEAINTAYMRLEDPVLIKRQMLYLKPGIWILADSFRGKGEHTYSRYFNFPDQKVAIQNNGLSTLHTSDNLRIQPLEDIEIQLSDAWWSPEYNLKKPVRRAEFSAGGKGFQSFTTLLYFPEHTRVQYEKIPVYDRNDNALDDEDAEAVKIRLPEKEYIWVIAHRQGKRLHPFLIVEGQVVTGDVILIEKTPDTSEIHVLK
ncbi:Heparinase II/III-like protein [Sinomicrobium oceani]|uniref:Heparinase II/III-like protein n=1 Tax=Sinomicrobium oceani TaxID=1150368 RepID=A0A1K1MXN8_9FLAO|nr:alginate lyase family protein [Sinomicrobium oceani]SFW27972.1 Heparinase II/III-like protein [Sinomicrobium oceani]